jgi:hypothetical protein
MREDKKCTIIKLPKKTPEIKYYSCRMHHVRMVPVGEEGTLRYPLCGSNIAEEETEDSLRISGTI